MKKTKTKSKNLLLVVIIIILVIAIGIALGIILQKSSKVEKEKGVKKDKMYCEVDEDCVCGIDKETGQCAFGNKEYIDTSNQCVDFCTGIHGGFRIVCKNNICTQVLKEKFETEKWKYKRNVEISNPGLSLKDYQVLITLDTSSLITEGKMSKDCRDIKFLDSDNNTQLNYWIESGCNSRETKIWVKVPYLAANSNKTIYLYYGNPSAFSKSNRKATMTWFDDFDLDTLSDYEFIGVDATPAIYSGYIEFGQSKGHSIVYPKSIEDQDNVCVRARVMVVKGNWWAIWVRSNVDLLEHTSYGFNGKPSSQFDERPTIEKFIKSGRYQLVGAQNLMSNEEWYDVEGCIWQDGSVVNLKYKVNGFPVLNFSDNSNQKIVNPGKVGMGSYEGSLVRYDYFEIRKYTFPEPKPSVGREEVLQ